MRNENLKNLIFETLEKYFNEVKDLKED